MPKYRKKPVIIEAIQWTGEMEPEFVEFAHRHATPTSSPFRMDYMARTVLIQTLEGVMRAEPGDWIICGVNGELYPCKPDIFAKTYEAV